MGSDVRLLGIVDRLRQAGHEVSLFFRAHTDNALRVPPSAALATRIGVRRVYSEAALRSDVRHLPPPALYEFVDAAQVAQLFSQGWFNVRSRALRRPGSRRHGSCSPARTRAPRTARRLHCRRSPPPGRTARCGGRRSGTSGSRTQRCPLCGRRSRASCRRCLDAAAAATRVPDVRANTAVERMEVGFSPEALRGVAGRR